MTVDVSYAMRTHFDFLTIFFRSLQQEIPVNVVKILISCNKQNASVTKNKMLNYFINIKIK
jgi:hypothetical protein